MNRSSVLRIAFALAAFLATAWLATAATPPDAQPVILIQNATVLTVTQGTIEHGSVLIKDGKISEVGSNVKAPSGAQVIDGTGMFVTPGIIDCHSHIAVDGSVNEGSISVSSIANIAEVLDSVKHTLGLHPTELLDRIRVLESALADLRRQNGQLLPAGEE